MAVLRRNHASASLRAARGFQHCLETTVSHTGIGMASSSAQPAPNDALTGGRAEPAAVAEVPSPSEQPWLARRRRGWLVRRALLAADTCGLVLACVATEALLGPPASGSAQNLSTSEEVALFLLTIPIWVLLAKVYGLYERDEERPAHTTVDDLVGVFNLVTVGVWAIAVGAWATEWLTPDFGRLAFFWATAIALVVIARSIARGIVRRTSSYRQRTLIVGGDRIGQLLAEKLVQRPESGIELVGYATERQPGNGLPALNGLPVLGTPRELPSIVSRSQIDRVIVTELDESDAPAVVRSLRARNVQVDLVPRPLEATGLSGSMHIARWRPPPRPFAYALSQSSLFVKRTMDVVISGVGLVLFAPVVALIAIVIKLDSRGPVFYRHDRIGRNGRPSACSSSGP